MNNIDANLIKNGTIEDLFVVDVPDTNVGDLISRQAALAEIDKNRDALLQSGMTGAEHILVRYGRRVIEELPTAEPKRGTWIPCSERLPEVNERCLCTYEFSEGTCVDFGLYTKRGWFVSGVTAWMPLPEPYKAERSGNGET